MTEESFKRKLTAILSADVEGYSRLMGEDEDATIRTLTSYRELMSTLIQKHRGRVVDSPGDNLLAEFLSVVDAVRCAVEIQEELRVRNAELPENRRMQFRIGINLGDVVEEQERIYGDGVNIAARVEGLAKGGGICISGTVYDSIKNKLSLSYESIGEHTVKNIKEPVRVYRMRVGPEAGVKPSPRRWQRAALTAVAVLVVVAGAWAIWNFYFRPPPIDRADPTKIAYPLPDKPSIAVLSFVNMSGDSEQEYIADGITENITTALSKIPEIFVIARTSTMTYKGKPVKVKQVSEELGVKYVLEGSVQKEGDRVRITAQLVDAIKGLHLWAEKYDREIKGFFDLLDEITKEIGTALQVKLTWGDQASYASTNNFEAWGLYNKAYSHFLRYSKTDNAKARELCEMALELDPEYVIAFRVIAYTHLIDFGFGWSKSPRQSIKRAEEFAQKALAINEYDGGVRALLCAIYNEKGQHEKAIAEGERAITLDPSYSIGYLNLSDAMQRYGKFEEAIPLIKMGMRLHGPYFPAIYLAGLGRSQFQLGRYEEALATYKALLERSLKGQWPKYIAHLTLAANYVGLGRMADAREHADEVLRLNPKFSLEVVRKRSLYKDPDHLEKWLDAYRKAGLPETPPLPLPDKPSIAVLPFVNMSGDPEQEYFSDGITEEIITALSKTPKMFVIARTSSFKYKGKEVDVRRVGRELGVQYVLEGSVRKAGDKVRVTAQLVDAKTGKHLWAERYDRDLEDIFAIQDNITKNIIMAVQVQLTEGEQARLRAKGTENLDAYLKYLKATEYMLQFNKEDNIRARKLAEETIALDPSFQKGYAILAFVEIIDVWVGLSTSPKESLMRAMELAKKSIAIEDSPLPHRVLATTYVLFRKHDPAIAEARKAVEMAPNYADAYMTLGHVLTLSDMAEEAIHVLEKAIRLNPYPTSAYFHNLAFSYLLLARYEEAISEAKKAISVAPYNVIAHRVLISSYWFLGREDEARTQAAEHLRIDPDFSVELAEKRSPLKNKEKNKKIFDSYRKAGLK